MTDDRHVTVHVSTEFLAELCEWSEPVQVQVQETPGIGTGYEMVFRRSGPALGSEEPAQCPCICHDRVDDLTPDEQRELLRIPTHTVDGVRLAEWEREFLARQMVKGPDQQGAVSKTTEEGMTCADSSHQG